MQIETFRHFSSGPINTQRVINLRNNRFIKQDEEQRRRLASLLTVTKISETLTLLFYYNTRFCFLLKAHSSLFQPAAPLTTTGNQPLRGNMREVKLVPAPHKRGWAGLTSHSSFFFHETLSNEILFACTWYREMLIDFKEDLLCSSSLPVVHHFLFQSRVSC